MSEERSTLYWSFGFGGFTPGHLCHVNRDYEFRVVRELSEEEAERSGVDRRTFKFVYEVEMLPRSSPTSYINNTGMSDEQALLKFMETVPPRPTLDS